MASIGKLAGEFGLSRSTLLYYDSIGLLCPSKRSEAGYRIYEKRDMDRLHRICRYREAGLSLSDIQRLLEERSPVSYFATLEKRLSDLNEEIGSLRRQQQVIVGILKEDNKSASGQVMNKEQWIELLRTSGLDEAGMQRWHCGFEKLSGSCHHDFLRSLGLDEKEIQRIRRNSR